MRAGANPNSVQHLLTPAALAVVKHAATEARGRGHPQVQPLHVAAMLLAHTGSRLRQVCMLSHPHSSQTPKCRALEVCFNVALDHLAQSASAATAGQPVLSNALMAALKRAHAHQRRGCPEHQQSPLLAVKVEIDQLIISILDDPSVSRVMREAGFRSTSVKYNLEDGAPPTPHALYGHEHAGAQFGLELASQGAYHGGGSSSCVTQDEKETKASVKLSLANSTSSPWQQQPEVPAEVGNPNPNILPPSREDDIRNVLEVLLSPRNRNAVLMGETPADANAVVRDLASRIKQGSVPPQLQGLQFLDPQLSSSSFGFCSSLEIEQKLAELSKIVGECMPAGAILHIGDLQWLAEPMQLKKGPSHFCPAQHTAAELGRLLLRHARDRLWFVGLATCEIFSRLQARYPALKSEWGLQPVHVAALPPPQRNLITIFAANGPQQVQDGGGVTTPLRGAHRGRPPMLFPRVPEGRLFGDDRGPEKLQFCADCLAKFEDERRLVHEHERLALHLAPAEWFSLSRDGAGLGGSNASRSQVKNQSVIQKLSKLRQKWQATCNSLHGHAHTSVPVNARPELSPLSHLYDVTRGRVDSKPCRGLDSAMFGPWPSSQNNSLGLSISDHLEREPSSIPDYAQSSSRGGGVRKLASEVQVQDAVLLVGAHGSPEAPCAPDIGSPKDGSSVASGPDEQDDHHVGSTGSSAQDVCLAPVHTDLALGRAADKVLCSSTAASPMARNATASATATKFPLWHSANASPIALRNGGMPHWLTQSPMQKARLQEPAAAAAGVDASPLQGLPWQLSASPLAKRPPPLGARPPGSHPPGFKECVVDSLKGLYKGLMQRVPWQGGAIAAMAATVMQCRSSMGTTRGATLKTDTWMLLLGPDRAAKRTLARALAELVFGGEKSLMRLRFAAGLPARLETGDGGGDLPYRGRTPLDSLAEAVRLRPSSVILLEDIEHADSVIQAGLGRAMERGKLAGSNGREVSFGNTIVLMTTSIGADPLPAPGALEFSEEKLAAMGQSGILVLVEDVRTERVVFRGHHCNMTVVDRGGEEDQAMETVRPGVVEVPDWVPKRKPDALLQSMLGPPDVAAKRAKSGDGRFLCLDLNLAGPGEYKPTAAEGTQSNSTDGQSDVNKEEARRERALLAVRATLSPKFCDALDHVVMFDPYDFAGVADEVLRKLADACEDRLAPHDVPVEIDLRLLEHMLASVWKMPGGRPAFDAWVADVFSASLAGAFPAGRPLCGAAVVKLVGIEPDFSGVEDAFEGAALPRAVVFGPA